MAAVSNNSVSAVRGGWTSSTIVCVSLNKYLNFRGIWYGDSPFDFIYPHGFGQNHHPVSSLPLVVLPSPPSQAAQIRLLCPVGSCLIFAQLSNFPGILAKGGPFAFYVPLSLSYTFFPVLTQALEELNLLNSELGQLAMSSAVLNDLIFWFFLALSIVFKQEKLSQSVQALCAFITLVIFTFTVVRLSAPILGSLFLGLVIPGGPPFGSAIVQKTESTVSEFLMPIFYIQVGYSTDVHSIHNWPMFIKFQIIIALVYFAKFIATFLASLTCKIRCRSALMLGLIMNIKGILELIHYHRWRSSQVNLLSGQR
ncbi:hypothetical protein TIFTF001_010447 [Ficus carica]|uniref:Cation/H+ exchanger transmembrane domain-containing protein n=1 Tax=Ficus carica TaxID=3494 RepID=A0AA87ZWH0_FICCA|nr:hypothetical protein TIFTF001_010447 [Ficus carica]